MDNIKFIENRSIRSMKLLDKHKSTSPDGTQHVSQKYVAKKSPLPWTYYFKPVLGCVLVEWKRAPISQNFKKGYQTFDVFFVTLFGEPCLTPIKNAVNCLEISLSKVSWYWTTFLNVVQPEYSLLCFSITILACISFVQLVLSIFYWIAQ